ncbi:MAG TPA: M1 family aminopeptidase, partial [bacterium]
IWLNEGFATYAEALFIETMYGPAAFREKIERMKEDYFDQALNRIDFPMYDPPASSFFNYGIVYAKAGLVLHMLRKGVGESIFWRILQEFYQTYCYGNASTEEFQAVCERVSQKPLGSFFRQWVYGKGFPQIAYSHMFLPLQSGGTKVVLQIQQLQESDSPFQMPLDVRLAGIRDTTVWIDTPSEMFVFAVDRMPDSVVIDPDGWLLARTTRLPSGLRESGAAPKRFTLFPPFPNPFNTAVTLYYDVSDSSAASRLSLTVYNLAGQEVAVLLDNAIPVPGMYQTAWNGTDNKGKPLPSGVYVIRMQADAFSLEQKAVLLR